MRKLNPREFVNITPLLTACDSEFRRRGLGGQLSSRSAWWSQLGTESLVLGLPDSPKCPHRKYSAGVAVMGPHTQGYAPRTYLGTAVWPAIQNLPTHWVGGEVTHILPAWNTGPQSQNWSRFMGNGGSGVCHMPVLDSYICHMYLFSLGSRECIREFPCFCNIKRRVETYCLFSWLIKL